MTDLTAAFLLREATTRLSDALSTDRPKFWMDAEDVRTLLAGLAEAQRERDNLKTVMIAAAEEISAHWDAHCDAEGYGPANLMHRLEQGIPSQYGYTAGAFAELKAERDTLRARVAELEAAQARAIAEAVEVALDPRVSSDAQALIDRGAAQASTGARVDKVPADDVQYPRDLFHALIGGNSPYAFYLFQWVPYQTDARRWRLKMLHDVRTFDGRGAMGIWPNGSHCGPFRDDEVEFIRISRKQWGEEWTDPRPAPAGIAPAGAEGGV